MIKKFSLLPLETMKISWCIPVYIFIFVVAICVFRKKDQEKFTIAERNGIFCDPRVRNTGTRSQPIRGEENLMPRDGSEVFILQGYNYKETPKIYRNGKKIVPLQYFWNYSATAYYFTVYAPGGLCASTWMIETSDYVMPIVNDGRSGAKIDVTLERRRNEFNRWNLVPACSELIN